MKVSMIVAADLDDCIGIGDELPWHIPADLSRFKELTLGHVCIAGSKTQASIMRRLGKPLPGRSTIVVTRSTLRREGVLVVESPDTALRVGRKIEELAGGEELFVIGGIQIYTALLDSIDRIYLTRVAAHVEGDGFMPVGWLDKFVLTEQVDASNPRVSITFETYERRM